MHELIIKGGTIVDGTGQPSFTGDVAVTAGRITSVGKDLGPARRPLKADGLLVTPGWVVLHTHHDDGECREYPASIIIRWHELAVGNLSRIPRCARDDPAGY